MGARQRLDGLDGARPIVTKRETDILTPAGGCVIGNQRSLAGAGARPLPARKVALERRVAVVDVEISVPDPPRRRLTKIDLHPGTWRDWSPAVAVGGVERKCLVRQCRRVDANDAL